MNIEKLASVLPDWVPQIHVYDCVSSTNTVAKQKAETEKEGIYVARCQTGGKGRLGRSFFSPKNSGLYMTFLLRPDLPPEKVGVLTTTAAVAVCETLELFSGREARIKWVNDVLIDDKKVCGILTEGGIDGERLTYAVVGIGINLFPPEEGFPEDIVDKAGYVFSKKNDCLEELTADLICRYLRLLGEDCHERYVMRSIVCGREVSFFKDGEKKVGVVQALDENCALIVRLKNGETERLDSGEASIEGLY